MKKYIITTIALVFLFPLIWMTITSIQPETADISLLPQKVTFGNYINLFKLKYFTRWNFNSIFIASITAVLMCLFSTMAGYALSKLYIPYSKVIFLLMIGTMAIPKQAIMVPLFQLMRDMKMIDTYPGLILPMLAWPFGIFLMHQFIQTLPTEVLESARIDGASEWMIFWKIIIPLSKPAITALVIFTFVRSYNDYFWQLIMTRSAEMKTLPLAVAGLQQQFDQRLQLVMAGSVMAALPMLIVFVVFSGKFIKGINLSGANK